MCETLAPAQSLDESQETIRQLQDELVAANKELEAFAYSVSHDLRTPLRSINGFGRMLEEDYGDQLDETARGYLNRLRTASQRMGELIDDLLKLSRLSREPMVHDPVDLSQLGCAVMSGLQAADSARSVEVVVQDRMQAIGDRRLLRIVLENLLGNAWKFTSKHPAAKIELGCSVQDGASVYFVRDDGAGFDMAYAARLFGAFQRMHGQSDFKGTGIGLAIAQRIVHRHGGRIWVEAAVEKGATFFFTLTPKVD